MSEYEYTEADVPPAHYEDDATAVITSAFRAEQKYERLKARRAAEDRYEAEQTGNSVSRVGYRHISAHVAAAVEEVSLTREYGLAGLKTGIPSLDKHLSRALVPGSVVLNVGGTKASKTAFMGQLLLAFAAQGAPILLGSYEDDQKDTVKRYLANLTSGDVGAIRDGFRRADGSLMPIPGNFDDGVDKLAALGIHVLNEAGTVEQIATDTGHWDTNVVKPARAPFGVLALDQLSHIVPTDRVEFARTWPGYPPPPRIDDNVKMLEWQTDMLVKIAKRWNVLVLLNHQLNTRHEEYEVPTVRSIRGSQGIAHKVHAVIGPHRPAKLKNEAAGLGEPKFVDNTEGRSWLIGIIGRTIMPFEEEVQWDGAGQRFLDLGASRTAPWAAPTALTDKQREGMLKLAALRSAWDQSTSDSKAAAVAGVEAPVVQFELPRLVTDTAAVWETPPAPVRVGPRGNELPPVANHTPAPPYAGAKDTFGF